MNKGNVLVVDDRAENLNLLNEMLSTRGYEVRLFPRGAIALTSAAAEPPDLILLDIMMPDMDGYEVCRKLKGMDETRDIPIIFISAKSMPIDKVKAFTLGGVDYVTKPFQVEEVLARVRTHLSLRRYQMDLEMKNLELETTLEKLKFAQTRLIHSEKMASIGILAAGIAHELNNPINFISISTKGLKKKFGPVVELLLQLNEKETLPDHFSDIQQMIDDLDLLPRKQAIEELTENIETGAERAVDVVSGLRLFSRLDTAEKEMTDVHRALESALIILQNQTRDSITIRREYGDDVPKIPAFPGKLAQVFMNILKNAIDAISSKPDDIRDRIITVRTELNGDKKNVSIKITDTGPGISEAEMGRLFDPFYTTKEVGKGTGLGLSIVLGIVESHSGRIEVDSEENKGSTFTVYLPVE